MTIFMCDISHTQQLMILHHTLNMTVDVPPSCDDCLEHLNISCLSPQYPITTYDTIPTVSLNCLRL